MLMILFSSLQESRFIAGFLCFINYCRVFVIRGFFLFLLFSLTGALNAQDRLGIKSVHLRSVDSVLVYKPAAYLDGHLYPVVYLLHGHSANFTSWSKLMNLQQTADKYGFIIVCPDGLKKSWYMNSPNKDSLQYESFFLMELMPALQKRYQIDRTKQFITGASMGGHGAMYLFLRHPDLFLSAGSTSGVLNLRYSGFKKTTLAAILGPYSEENKAFDDYSVVNLLSNISGLNKQIIFDSGTEDYLYITSRKFREKCDELKIKATYIAQPGGHTGGYWSRSMPVHFEFFHRILMGVGN